ncbi:SGNH/GDSL hydrolase family protein, partial [Sandarakinorhabdus sp.]|uniref:SGNH/GDSL hydrolase family protein n=1 Tax=Sandarakinorhabdus sp. TaxID=1916663 RepID=UPI00333EA726
MIDRSFVIYGDSRTRSSSSQEGIISNNGYAGWAEAYSGNEVFFARNGNYAIKGAINSGWRELFAAYVASPSRNAVLYIGWNRSAYSDSTLSTEDTRLQIGSMLDQLGAAGKTVFLVSETPQSLSPGNPRQIEMHEWLASPTGALLGRPFVVPVNAWDALEDPANPNFPRPEYVYDGLHLTVKGNQVLGEAIAKAMDAHFADTDLINLAQTNGDGFTAANLDGVLIANPLLEGTGGMRSGAVTGDVATGWTVATNAGASGVNVVASKGISNAGFAEQIISFSGTPTGAGATIRLTLQVPLANVQIGDALRAGAVIEFDPGGTGVLGISPSLTSQTTSGAVLRTRGLAASIYDLPSDGFNLAIGTSFLDVKETQRFVTYDIVISLRTNALTQGTVRISQATIRDSSEAVDAPPPPPPVDTNVPPDAENDRTVTLLEDAAPVAL